MNRRKKERFTITAGVITVPLIIILGWHLGSMILGEMVLPTPWDTIEELRDGLLGGGWLLADLGYTMIELVCGFALAALVGLALGLLSLQCTNASLPTPVRNASLPGDQPGHPLRSGQEYHLWQSSWRTGLLFEQKSGSLWFHLSLEPCTSLPSQPDFP